MTKRAEDSRGDIGSGRILRRKSNGAFDYCVDDLTVEEPLEIRVGPKTLAVTMRTPGHDEELAAGFMISEGLVQNQSQIQEIKRSPLPKARGNVVTVTLAPGVKLKLQSAQRFGTISTSCGVCGKTSIAAIRQQFPGISSSERARISSSMLLGLPDLLRTRQSNFSRTGGIHAAAIFDVAGKLLFVREDIGRHNAVDKVIGRAFLDGLLPLSRHVLFVSGRSSFEIVQKALSAAIPIVASVSAPSTLAANFARECGQTLIGFLRPPSFNIYSHAERVIMEDTATSGAPP